MNQFVKIIPAFALALGAASLVGCGDDSSSGDEEVVSSAFNLEGSFEIDLEKGMYAYKSKDSTMAFYKPVCKVGTLGNLVWSRGDEDVEPVTAFIKKSTITVDDGEETQNYTFSGKKFPVGDWLDPDNDKKSIQNAQRLTSYNMFKKVFRYSGKCFLKDFYASFYNSNSALAEYDSLLSGFYKRFLGPDDEFSAKTMLNDIRASDCDEMSMYDGLVVIKINELKESSGSYTVSYKNKSCPIKFNIRYAFEKADCEAAYDDFEASKDKEFVFDNYWKTMDYDDYCIEELILQMKKEQGIPLKKEASLASEAKAFAGGIVDVMFSGIK